jgi:hypothetical protein
LLYTDLICQSGKRQSNDRCGGRWGCFRAHTNTHTRTRIHKHTHARAHAHTHIHTNTRTHRIYLSGMRFYCIFQTVAVCPKTFSNPVDSHLSGMLKQKTYQQCFFTINQAVNKPNNENGCNYENFMAHFKCMRSKLVGNGYSRIISVCKCWHVRNGFAPIAPVSFVSCMLSLCSQ